MKSLLLPVILLVLIAQTAQSQQQDAEDYRPNSSSTSLQDNDSSIFDETRIHVGISLIQSLQNYLVAPGMREKGGLRGFQLSLGVDLFSPNWIAEGTVMNFPQDTIDNTKLSLTGFELRFLYEKPILYGVTLHGGVGIGNRVYGLKTTTYDKSFSSGAGSLVAGVDYWPSGEVSAGVEVSNHMPLAAADDPSSLDFAFKLTGHF